MGKKGGSQTTTQSLDPHMQAYVDQVMAAAKGASGSYQAPGVNPMTTSAGNYYGAATGAGNLGMGALSGDPNAVHTLMNPYQTNVMDDMAKRYGDIRAATSAGVNDAATQAGAFGGSRHGVAEGTALAQTNKDEATQMAGLGYQGYNDAMTRAGQMANFGMGAAGSQAQLGEYLRQLQEAQMNPQLKQLSILQGGMAGMPYGTSTKTTQQAGRNPAAGAIGGASTGAEIGSQFGGPWGTGIGAGIGGLLGLFS